MPQDESESKPSRRLARRAARKKPPMSVRLGVFLSPNDADILDEEAEANGLSVSAYLRRLISRGRQALMADEEARAAEATTRSRTPQQDAFEATLRKAEEDRLLAQRDHAQSKALRRSTLMVRDGR